MSEYTDAVERGLEGLRAASVGTCPGCPTCEEDHRYEGELIDEGSFSMSRCGICGTSMGGNRFAWHWINPDGEIVHENDACTDCVMFMANGEEPDQWER
jgi:hypothetical protein